MKARQLLLKQRSVFASWIGSYLIVIFVCSLVSPVIYRQADSLVSEERNRLSAGMIRQVQQSLDGRLGDILKLETSLSLNRNLQGMYYLKDPLSPADYYAERDLMKDFAVLCNANSFIRSFYIYLSGTSTVLAADSVYDRRTLYDELHRADGISYDEWIALVDRQHRGEFIPLYQSGEKQSRKTVAYMKSLLPNNKDPRVTLVILFDESTLREAVSAFKAADNGNVMILDSQNRVISAGGETVPLAYSSFSGPSGLSYREWNGEQMAVTYQKSDVSDWVYLSVVPVVQFRESAEKFRQITFALIFGCLCLSVAVASVLARKNYHPVREIIRYMQRVQDREGHAAAGESNEFDFIRDFIHSTQQEKEKYYRGWKKYSVTVRANFLCRLLKGETDGAVPDDALLNEYGIVFHSDLFAVMLFRVEDSSRFIGGKDYESRNLVSFAVSNVVEELANRAQHGYVVDCGDMVACLVNFQPDGSADRRSELRRIAREAEDFFTENLKIGVTLSLSGIHESIRGIPDAYREAVEAMEYREILGSGILIDFEKIQPVRSNYPYPFEMQRRMLHAIQSGDFKSVSAFLDEIFHGNRPDRYASIETMQCIMFGLVNTVLQALDETGDTPLPEFGRPAERLLRCRAIPEMEREVRSILKDYCESRQKSCKKKRNVALIDRITDYVATHYRDCSMGISGMADDFGMNPIYLSHCFKEQTGESLLDYIARFRIGKSEELIRSGCNVREVAERVGYGSSNTFIRVFKKYEGTTPGRFAGETEK